MKISHLTENTVTSMPAPGQPAAEFGRNNDVLESDCGTTASGSIASVPAPVSGMQRRGKGSMFQGIKTSEKFANSRKAGIEESQINEVDPRNFDSDVDYYAARNAPTKARSHSRPSPGVNQDDEAYFREIFRKKREAAKKAEREQDHDRLATGTNEGQFPDTSNSLAKRTVRQAEVPNVTKNASGHPTVQGRADSTRKTYATRVEPTITSTKVQRKDDRPIPSFLQKGVAEGERMKTASGMYRDQHTGVAYRGKTGQDGNDSYMTPDYLIQKYQERLAQIASGPYKRPKEVAQLKSRIAKLQGQQGVAEGSEDKIKQLKQDYATAIHWSKNDTNPHKREAARQKAEKIKAHLEKQYKQGVAESSGQILSKGTTVTVVHKGKQVKGKIVRYDAGKNGYSNAYVVDVGDYESIFVPAAKIKMEGVAEGTDEQLPQETLDLIDEYIAKVEPDADRNKMIQDVVDGYIHTSELEYALQEGVTEGSNDTVYPNAEVIKSKNGKPVGEIYQDASGWGCFHYGADNGADSIESREEALEWLKDIAEEYRQDRSLREQGVAEGHADQQRKIFKKNGKPVGEVGIDRESSPGNGQWYMKCYAYNIDNAGYDSYEEAVAELKHCLKQGVAEGYTVTRGIDKERFTERPGLEGPFSTKNGKVVYYDKVEGKYYDPETDFYIGNDDWQAMNEAEIAEDKLANDLYKDFQIFKKSADRDIGSKAKNKEISGKAKDKEIVTKEDCWKGYNQYGMKDKGGKKVPNCVPANESEEYDDEAGSVESDLHTLARAAQGLIDTIGDRDNLPEWVQEKIAKAEGMVTASWDYLISQKEQGIDPQVDETAAWQKKSGKNKNGGLNQTGVDSYRKEHPGSKLQTAVTTPPSELKAGSKDAKRRKSFCARMSGMEGPMKKPNGEPTRKALSLKKWNC